MVSLVGSAGRRKKQEVGRKKKEEETKTNVTAGIERLNVCDVNSLQLRYLTDEKSNGYVN